MFNAIKVLIHESWTGRVIDGFDIAMLKLDREAKFGLPSLSRTLNPNLTDAELVALGWWKNASNELDSLQIVQNIPYIPKGKCNKFWNGIVKENQLCGGLLYTDACHGEFSHIAHKRESVAVIGESGAPLLIPDAPLSDITKGMPLLDLVVGITSYLPTRCKESTPAVFTDVAHFTDWILDNIKNDFRHITNESTVNMDA